MRRFEGRVIDATNRSVQDLVSRHCALLYSRLGTYEAVAERVGIDRRTVKRRVLRA